MMKQTANLRFIKRQVDKDVYRILQQQWIDDDPPDEGASRYAWRDVPIAEEQEQVDSGREAVIEECANIALAIDSGRGNEKEIAKAIRRPLP